MRRRRRKKYISWFLIAAGGVLLVAGAREVVDSYLGQRQAAEAWETARPPAPARETEADRGPDLGTAFARLEIPRLNSSWFVFEGTGKKDLRLGPGHVRGTAPPGTRGNCVIAAHRDTHFRALKDIRQGDEIEIQTHHGAFRYRVSRIRILRPDNTGPMQPTDHAVLNLITCYPFYYVGPAPKRFVVEARLEESTRRTS